MLALNGDTAGDDIASLKRACPVGGHALFSVRALCVRALNAREKRHYKAMGEGRSSDLSKNFVLWVLRNEKNAI
jgi:hypothetical protein